MLDNVHGTKNCLKGFYRGLNNLFTKAHSDIVLFDEKMLKETLISSKKMLNILYSSINTIPKCRLIKDQSLYNIAV